MFKIFLDNIEEPTNLKENGLKEYFGVSEK